MSRGFLPRGLSNTCPQACAMRGAVASHGQVANKPKHFLSSCTGSFLASHLAVLAPQATVKLSPEGCPTEVVTHG